MINNKKHIEKASEKKMIVLKWAATNHSSHGHLRGPRQPGGNPPALRAVGLAMSRSDG